LLNPDLGPRSDRWRLPAAAFVLAALALAASPAAAFAGATIAGIGLPQILWMAVTAGSALAAMLAMILVLRGRADDRLVQSERRAEELRVALDRAEALLASDESKTIVWETSEAPPRVIGTLPERVGAPFDYSEFFLFDRWLIADSAARLEEAIERLRDYGEAFQVTLRTQAGAALEVIGRTSGKRALARLRELTGERRSFAELKEQAAYVVTEVSALRALAHSLPMPVWRRSRHGRLTWVNGAYAAAVGAPDAEAAVRGGMELFDASTRSAARLAHSRGQPFCAIIERPRGENVQRLEVQELAAEQGSIGVAVDVSEVEALREEFSRTTDSYVRTLDQLNAAVAVFDRDRRLRFFNAAYRAMWDLPQDWLEAPPEEGAILDRLRADRKLPEQANYRDWRDRHLAGYEAGEPREQWWHLPDGRSLRVVSVPDPEGGLTRIFENVTEQLSLQSRLEALSQLQGETLDHLREGVAVFGSDGRLRLFNPVFAHIWHLSPHMLSTEPHIAEIVSACASVHRDVGAWEDIRRATTELERGEPAFGQMERPDGSVIDYATVALPEGMTMVTFVDVTDTARIQKVLEERNEALEAADRLKSAFIQHVSYELRSPLTSIIGFSEMVADETIGTLNAQQREYMDHIAASSAALLAIINDILDLATVDAGIMALDITEVDPRRVADAAIEGLRDRLEEQSLRLVTRFADDLGTFHADEHRVRQILFNLLSNAVRFSHAGGAIELSAEKEGARVKFTIRDEGVGIPSDVLPTVFAPFEGHDNAGRRRGAGLGLSIVKSLVELHGGTIDIQSAEGRGTTVTVRFPELWEAAAVAAE
jgi:signal transduction histidine kinase